MILANGGSRVLGLILLAAAAACAASPAPAQQRVGVSSAVNPDAQGTLPGGQAKRLVIGQEVVHNEHITTDTGGQTQILFVDGSSMAIGPNSDLTIDEFVYDPKGGGQLTMSAARGVLRFVGGELSKQEGAVSLKTPSATIGIRGGIFLLSMGPNGALDVTFVYGKGLTVSGAGVTQVVTRPGFLVRVERLGAAPSAPAKAPEGTLVKVLSALNGQSGKSAGSTNPPTDSGVANSGIGQTVSGNVNNSVQSAQQNTQTTTTTNTTTTNTTTTTTDTDSQLNTVSSQSQTVISDGAQSPPEQGSQIQTNSDNTNNNNTNNRPPPPPQSVVVTVSGTVKSTNGPATQQGFIDQGPNGRIPYVNGQIVYPPPGVPLQNGVFFASSGANSGTLSPLTPGTTTQVTGTDNTGGTATGVATMTPDGKFFYANLQSSNGQREFVYGGVPVSQGFYAATATPQITAFKVNPDAALGGPNSGAQAIPFLPAFAGGTMANAKVSPLYVVTPGNTSFGSYNASSNPNALSPRWVQASLAVNGQGAGQSSALVVSVGQFQTSNQGNVVGDGQVRGTVMSSATAPVTSVNSTAATVADGAGNTLFGGNAISGFVIDQNSYQGGAFRQNNAAASTSHPGGTATTAYAFNQPVTSAALPNGVGTNRTALNQQGYFGGIVNSPTQAGIAVMGDASVRTNPAAGTVAATFNGADPFTAQRSGVNAIQLNFGSPSATDGRSAFVDNNNYAAVETAGNPATVTTQGQQTAYSQAPLALVTSNMVASNTLLPSGVSFCECQFLQWGYWSASLQTGSTTAPQVQYAGQINTWVAGQPTVTMPSSGVGSFSGAAVGTVSNNGASYLAAGGFTNTYNFGTNRGLVTISNFDGKTFSGAVAGGASPVSYSGPLAGSGLTGVANGTFYGPNAAETGGNFSVTGVGGAPYTASGIFAGKR